MYRPAAEILVVSVQPPSIRAGGEVQLVVNYTISGLPEGARFEVTERRTLQHEGRPLTSSDAPTARSNGTYTSALAAKIPASAPPGIYRLEVEVGLPGAESAAGGALFEVVP